MDRFVKIICTICARGGSKGVKNKNLKLILGKPLIAHTIQMAKKSGLFEYIAVSSDSMDILNCAEKYEADLVIERPAELATDAAAKLPVIQHAFFAAEKNYQTHFDILVDLDCTSPLRNVDDLRLSLDLFIQKKEAANLITGMNSRRSPYFNLVELSDEGYVRLSGKSDKVIVRRQDAPACFDMNASIYIWRRESLIKSEKVISDKTIIYNMPEERSIDIDSDLDFEIVNYLMEKRRDEYL